MTGVTYGGLGGYAAAATRAPRKAAPAAVSLTAQDRCDRCGARALAAYRVGGLTLLMCAHHKRKHGDALAAAGAALVADETGD